VQQLLITLTQPSDAQELHMALTVMQQRAHPEILEFARLLQAHLDLYERQKADQLEARLQLHAISQELLASFHTSHVRKGPGWRGPVEILSTVPTADWILLGSGRLYKLGLG
jgi:hypothetical protein